MFRLIPELKRLLGFCWHLSRATAGKIVVSLLLTVSSQCWHVVRFVRNALGILLTVHFMLMRALLFAAGCFSHVRALAGELLTVAFRKSHTNCCMQAVKRGQIVDGSYSSTPTCVCVEDWEGAPEPKRHVHLKQPVGEDTEDEEKCGGAKQEPDWKKQIWICRYKQTPKH